MNEKPYIQYNYHTHTWRCMHATGTEKAFIEKAIEGGLKLLGFSDHTPMPFPADHVSTFRMRLDQLEDYCQTVMDLKKEYEKDIEIRLGLEAEYYPRCFDALLDYLRDYPIEYLILGQHCTKNEYDGVGCSCPTDDYRVLKQYVKQVLSAMDTGKFLYVAHPDIINFTGNREDLISAYEKICQKALEKDIPLEINLLGIHYERNYPAPLFWEVAGRTGNKVVIGIDCHHEDTMLLPEAWKKAMKLVKEYDLNLIEKLELMSPSLHRAHIQRWYRSRQSSHPRRE